MKARSFALALGLFVTSSGVLPAQRPAIAGRAMQEMPIQSFVRSTPPADSIIQRMWTEGMERSQAGALAQVLMDSIGPRLNASPGHRAGGDWLIQQYAQWGIPARSEQYGTWNSWERGVTHIDLVEPRVRSLEGMMLAWSPPTNGPTEGEAVILPEASSPEQFQTMLPQLRGKWVLISAPRLSCRMPSQWAEFGTPDSRAAHDSAQQALTLGWRDRALQAGNLQETMKNAGVLGVISSYWSQYPGINKIFGSWRQQVPTFDVSCEDYGLLYRLAENGQSPRVRINAESRFHGEQPAFNTIAEIRGTEKPDEYVFLSAHFDSWDGGSGATDNGTGTITMLEAMRILKKVYPNPKRTIIVGHWGGEEQGLNGSRAWTEDNAEVVQGIHAFFNQDNGTGRIVGTGPGGLVSAGPVLRRYLSEIPREITQHIRRFEEPGAPGTGGTDNASFACYGVPAFGLNALPWDYSYTTWHTNRDTYDKIVIDDLKNNATLVAMLAYLAAEDPEFMPRDQAALRTRDGQPAQWPTCTPGVRRTQDSRR